MYKAAIHELKIKKAYLNALRSWDKKCEIRFNDRDYEPGDYIYFYEIFEDIVLKDKKYGPYKITHVLSFIGLEPWYVALSLEKQGDVEDNTKKTVIPTSVTEDVPF